VFSKDVYSYLAQSAIAARGLDPYVLGPPTRWHRHPLTRSIPTVWRPTPAPYGPLFLWLGKWITALTGNDVVLGIFAHRLLALCGLALIVWALPRLAKRLDLDPRSALWLGVANPLVLFHLVQRRAQRGADARADAGRPGGGAGQILAARHGDHHPQRGHQGAGRAGAGLPRHVGGAAARRAVARRGQGRAAMSVVFGAVMTAVAYGTGLGFGWLNTLDTPNLIRSWVSVSTDLGRRRRPARCTRGLGDHTTQVVTLSRALGWLVAAAICVWLLFGTLRRPDRPGHRPGLRARSAVVLLSPTRVHLVPAVGGDPAAASPPDPYRRLSVAGSANRALLVPPTGPTSPSGPTSCRWPSPPAS